jgi:hypothetical protein
LSSCTDARRIFGLGGQIPYMALYTCVLG